MADERETGAADGDPGAASATPDDARCYRHPAREAYVRCVRCERRICPDCMVPAAVGFQCPDCVRAANEGVRRPTTVFGGRVSGDPGWVSKVLIGITVAVFVLQQVPALALERRFWLIGGPVVDPVLRQVVGVADGEVWRLLTAAFLHGGLLHLLLNMYALYLFGPPLEAALGRARFAALYVVAALGGSATSYAFGNPGQPSLGASGAVFGLLGAYLVVNRRLRRDSSGVLVLLAVNFAFGLLVPRIDWRAHLGGLVAGVLCALAFAYAPAARRTSVQAAGTVVVALLAAGLVAWRTAILA